MRLRDGERKTLADLGQQLGKYTLKAVATIVSPDIILAGHRRLVAQHCDGSPQRALPAKKASPRCAASEKACRSPAQKRSYRALPERIVRVYAARAGAIPAAVPAVPHTRWTCSWSS
jgi:hypothetical protein